MILGDSHPDSEHIDRHVGCAVCKEHVIGAMIFLDNDDSFKMHTAPITECRAQSVTSINGTSHQYYIWYKRISARVEEAVLARDLEGRAIGLRSGSESRRVKAELFGERTLAYTKKDEFSEDLALLRGKERSEPF